MSVQLSLKNIIRRLKSSKMTRIAGFGSSNTERRLPGMHWLDCLELGICYKYGRPHQILNAGFGGRMANNLLEHFESDLAYFKPHLVFVTVGGNDSNPEQNISHAKYKDDLLEIVEKIKKLEAFPVLQTYYEIIAEEVSPAHAAKFYEFMDIVREIASVTDSGLIDHLKRWQILKKYYPKIYRELMDDAFHVNFKGNTLMGVDILRCFEIFPENLPCAEYWRDAIAQQNLIDIQLGLSRPDCCQVKFNQEKVY